MIHSQVWNERNFSKYVTGLKRIISTETIFCYFSLLRCCSIRSTLLSPATATSCVIQLLNSFHLPPGRHHCRTEKVDGRPLPLIPWRQLALRITSVWVSMKYVILQTAWKLFCWATRQPCNTVSIWGLSHQKVQLYFLKVSVEDSPGQKQTNRD